MFLSLLPLSANDRVLNLGAGSGCFERVLKNQAIQLTSVESTPILLQLLRITIFYLMKQPPIINDCAENFITRCQQSFDVILIDIFSAQSHQALLQKHGFWHACFKRLTCLGKIAINLAPHKRATSDQLAVITASIGFVSLLS